MLAPWLVAPGQAGDGALGVSLYLRLRQPGQRRPAGERLPAAAVPAGAAGALDVHLHVPDLPGEGASPPDLAVHDEAAADPGADGDEDSMVVAAGRAQLELGQRGDVGVVIDDHRHRQVLAEQRPQVHLAAFDVRYPRQHALRPPDQAGHAGAHRDHVPIPDLAHCGDGGVGQLGGDARRRERRPVEHLEVVVESGGGDLGAADVDADGAGRHGTPRFERCLTG